MRRDQLGQILDPGHIAVFAHYRTDDGGVPGSGATAKFDGSFQRGGALSHTACRRDQRENMAGTDQIIAG